MLVFDKFNNRTSLVVSTLLTLLLFTTCQESYNPDDIDSSKKLLVVDGSITNNPGPYTVSLSYSSPFSDRYSYNFIRNAKVYISDDLGNTETLVEKGYGKYYTSKNGIRGTIGRKYKLRIELVDGSVYESVPAILNPAPVYDSIYPVMAEIDAVGTNGDGEVSVEKVKGVDLRFSVSTSEKSYYRLFSTVTTQWTHQKTPVGGTPIDVHCWVNSYLNSAIDVKSGVYNGSKYVIKEHSMGFLQYVFDNSMPKTDKSGAQISPKKQEGWDVITHIFSISPEAYIYYESIVKQLDAGERIFDPIPSQLRGNIHCLTDSSKIALGLFDVTSDSIVFNAFFWTPALHAVDHRTADTIPVITDNNCVDSRYPPFWVNFFFK